jgi:hypothetical protein
LEQATNGDHRQQAPGKCTNDGVTVQQLKSAETDEIFSRYESSLWIGYDEIRPAISFA